MVERLSERSFSFVIINTDPQSGLSYHAVSPSAKPGKIAYRTCMVCTFSPSTQTLDPDQPGDPSTGAESSGEEECLG
eukprot:3222228-Rhodomonas_salina.1